MRASSDAITRSAHRAKSLPPPTHQPCTWAITGLCERHTLMNRGTAPKARGGPGEVLARVPLAVGGQPLVPVMKAAAEVEARAEGAACAAEDDHLHGVVPTASFIAASISSGIGGTMVFSRSGRFSVIVAMPSVGGVQKGLVGHRASIATGPDGSSYPGRRALRRLAASTSRSGRGSKLEAPFDAPFEDRPGREALALRSPASSSASRATGRTSSASPRHRRARPTTAPIELFVDEEDQHAAWLGILRERFGGEKLESHWSDAAFVALRHIGGLRREICVLLTAEVVALSYYRVLPLAYDDPVLRRGLRAHPA